MSSFNQLSRPARWFLAALLALGLTGSGLTAVINTAPDARSSAAFPARSPVRPQVQARPTPADVGPAYLNVAEPPAGRSWIAFSAIGSDAIRGLYVVAPDGSAPHLLATGGAARLARAWSRDGRSIVVCRRVRPGTATPASTCPEDAGISLSILPVPRPVTSFDATPQLSPDRRQIAFVRLHDVLPASAALFILDLVSGRTVELVEFEANVSLALDWAPDGSALVYSSAPGGGVENLWLVEPGRRAPRRLTDLPADQEASSPTFSPDGSWIAFRLLGDGPPRLMRIRPDGTELGLIVELPALVPLALDWGPA